MRFAQRFLVGRVRDSLFILALLRSWRLIVRPLVVYTNAHADSYANSNVNTELSI